MAFAGLTNIRFIAGTVIGAALLFPVLTSAQTSDPSAAKDAYFSAQSLYDSGQYNDALAKLDEAKRLRGATDEYFLALRARIELERQDYDNAHEAVVGFLALNPSADMQATMIQTRIAIDSGANSRLNLWYRECGEGAGGGASWACRNIGLTYQMEKFGRGLLSPALAGHYYELACNSDNFRACHDLAILMEKELVPVQEDLNPYTLNIKACEGGNDDGCYALGESY